MATENVKEPNFEGEPMHLPTSVGAQTAPAAPRALNIPIIILLILILVALLGGLGYWYYQVISIEITPQDTSTRPSIEANNEPESTTAEARTAATDVVSTSDELDAIIADIESTNLSELDLEMTTIENELDAALKAQ